MRRVLAIGFALVFVVGGSFFAYKLVRPTNPVSNARLLLRQGDLKGAQLQLRNAIRADPGNWDAHLELSGLSLTLGDPVAAEKEVKLARETGADDARALPILAKSYLAQNKDRELLNEIRVEDVPDSAKTAILVARSLAQVGLGQAPQALAALTDAEKAHPDDPLLPITIAQIALNTQDLRLAETAINRVLQRDPKQPDGLMMKGDLLSLLGDRQGALAVYDSLIKLAPTSPNTIPPRLKRAALLINDGRDGEARKDVDFVLAAEPRQASAIYFLGILQTRAKQYEEADASLQRVADMSNVFPRVLFFIGVTKYALGQVAQASDAVTKYLSRNPTDADAIKLLARIELASHHPDQALERLSQAIQSGRRDAELLDLLGRAYQSKSQPNQAVEAFSQAVALAPANAEILTDLARARMINGDPAGAADTFQESLSVAPDQKRAGEAIVVAALETGDLDKASTALDRLRAQEGDSETVATLDAMIKRDRLDFPAAMAAFQNVVSRFPASLPARLDLARLRIMQGDDAGAEQTLRDYLTKDPSNEAALNMLSNQLTAKGQTGKVIELLEAGHAAAPTKPELTVALARAYIANGAAEKAISMLDHTAATTGTSAQQFAAIRADAMAALGRRDEAAEAYRQVLTTSPRDVAVRLRMAQLLVDLDRVKEARVALREGLGVMPGELALMQALVGIEYKIGGMPSALSTIAELQSDKTNMPAAASLKGDLLFSQQQYQEAAEAYRTALADTPTPVLVTQLATALIAMGQTDQAAQELRRWLDAHPSDDSPRQMLSLLDISQGHLGAAAAALEELVKHSPRDTTALNNLSWVYQQQRDPRAKEVAEKAYVLSQTPSIADTLGWILVTDGDAAAGLPLLREAASEQPAEPSFGYHLAVALKAVGQTETAISTLHRIVDAKGTFPERAAATDLLRQLTGAPPP